MIIKVTYFWDSTVITAWDYWSIKATTFSIAGAVMSHVCSVGHVALLHLKKGHILRK